MKTLKRVNTFMIEMIVCLFFFSLAVAVSLQFFTEANRRQALSKDITGAMYAAQTFIEKFEVQGTDVLKTDYNTEYDGSVKTIHFDEDWALTDSLSEFYMKVEIAETGQGVGDEYKLIVSVTQNKGGNRNNVLLFDAETVKYAPSR